MKAFAEFYMKEVLWNSLSTWNSKPAKNSTLECLFSFYRPVVKALKTGQKVAIIIYYNIPRPCLLNKSPVPAMDLKSNRSGLWRHMLKTCRRLRRLCRKRSNNVARHDKTPVKSTIVARHDKTPVKSTIVARHEFHVAKEWHYIVTFTHLEVAIHALSVCPLLQCCDIRHNFWCRPVYYKTLILWNSLIYTILKPCKWRHKPSQSSQRILACGSYSPYKISLGLWCHFYGFKIVQIIRLFHRISVNYLLITKCLLLKYMLIFYESWSIWRTSGIYTWDFVKRDPEKTSRNIAWYFCLSFATFPLVLQELYHKAISEYPNCNVKVFIDYLVKIYFLDFVEIFGL